MARVEDFLLLRARRLAPPLSGESEILFWLFVASPRRVANTPLGFLNLQLASLA
jgi:hypothetical protein